MEERLIKVEAKLDGVVCDMAEVKTALRDIARSLSKLAVLEEKHNNVSEAMKRAFTAIERNTLRIDEIEKALPDLYKRVREAGLLFKLEARPYIHVPFYTGSFHTEFIVVVE